MAFAYAGSSLLSMLEKLPLRVEFPDCLRICPIFTIGREEARGSVVFSNVVVDLMS